MTTETRTTQDVMNEIHAVQRLIDPLTKRLEALNEEWEYMWSAAWIRETNCRRADVVFSNAEGVPKFPNVRDFAEWLRSSGSTKRFLEWRGKLYVVSDLDAHRSPRLSMGRVVDLPD